MFVFDVSDIFCHFFDVSCDQNIAGIDIATLFDSTNLENLTVFWLIYKGGKKRRVRSFIFKKHCVQKAFLTCVVL